MSVAAKHRRQTVGRVRYGQMEVPEVRVSGLDTAERVIDAHALPGTGRLVVDRSAVGQRNAEFLDVLVVHRDNFVTNDPVDGRRSPAGDHMHENSRHDEK